VDRDGKYRIVVLSGAGVLLAGGAGGTTACGVASLPPSGTGVVSTGVSAGEGVGLGAAGGTVKSGVATVKSGVADGALVAGAVGPGGAGGAA